MSVAANRRGAEDAQGQAAIARSIGVWKVGGEMECVAAVKALLVSLRADGERPVQANHEFLGTGGVSPARVVRAWVHAYLECFDTAVAAVRVQQPARYSRLERDPLAIGAADQAAVEGLVLGEQRANGDVERASDAPQGLE